MSDPPTAQTVEALTTDAGQCAGCGGTYRYDTSIPSPLWNAVIRAAGLPEYLCAACIIREFARAGCGFTAELSGDGFSGDVIEVRVGGDDATAHALEIAADNTRLRRRVNELEAGPMSAGEVASSIKAVLEDTSLSYGQRIDRAYDSCVLALAYSNADPRQPSAPPARETWQPIETAPKDGTRVLVYACAYRRHWFGTGYYFKGVPGDGEGWIASSFYTAPVNDCGGSFEPTHWMPFPSPPESAR